jgi:hypothetical protein
VNNDEKIADRYLKSLAIGEVVYEPDGKVPPDFLVDGRIAVEVRRLNQHREVDGKLRGLEEDSISLRQSIENLLADFAAPKKAGTWFVRFSFHRPIPEWRMLRALIRDTLSRFLAAPADSAWRVPITESFNVSIVRATEMPDRCFLLGGYNNRDAGGWIVSEVVRNASAFISAKSAKVTPKYDPALSVPCPFRKIHAEASRCLG